MGRRFGLPTCFWTVRRRPDSMRFLYELLLPVALFLALRAILRQFLGGYRSSRGGSSGASRPSRPSSTTAIGELKKDPVCGTYVSTAGSLSQTVGGSPIYFCSKACRDKFLAR